MTVSITLDNNISQSLFLFEILKNGYNFKLICVSILGFTDNTDQLIKGVMICFKLKAT